MPLVISKIRRDRYRPLRIRPERLRVFSDRPPSDQRDLPAMLAGRFPGHLLKRAVKLRERLVADLEGDLADSQVRILQKIARLLDPARATHSTKLLPVASLNFSLK